MMLKSALLAWIFAGLMMFAGSWASAHEEEAGAKPGQAMTEEAPKAISIGEELKSHPHNKIVHFPVALGLTAFLFSLLCLRWPDIYPSCRLLLFLAAASAQAARMTGLMQAHEFIHGPLHDVLHMHANLGNYTFYGLCIGFALSLTPNSQKWLWVYLLFLAALISATGFYGGILATS